MSTNDREAYGAGIGLDEVWSIEVDKGGDVATVDGVDELGKDLAYQSARVLHGEIGKHLTQETLRDIEIRVKRQAKADPRVESIESIEARDEDGDVIVEMSVVAEDGEQDLVFSVN